MNVIMLEILKRLKVEVLPFLRTEDWENPGIGKLIMRALWRWMCRDPRRISFIVHLLIGFLRARTRRKKQEKHIGGNIPIVLAHSPTMQCNYRCVGCYSQGRDDSNELSSDELDTLFREAEELGVSTIVITGGEPFLRSDLVPLMEKHRGLLFVVITNGSLLSPLLAQKIAHSGNIITLVSIEGNEMETQRRRGEGAYQAAIRAMENLKACGVPFGFAATNTRENAATLISEPFINQMIAAGCTLGFFTEYVPCGEHPRYDWVFDRHAREQFHQKVLKLRTQKPLVLVQFPHDEYGKDDLCSAAGIASFHINTQGGVEPCPFSPYAQDNIRQGGLRQACASSFLKSIRSQPALLHRKEYACALFEHEKEIAQLFHSIEKGEEQ